MYRKFYKGVLTQLYKRPQMDLFMCSFNGQLLLLYTFFFKTAVLQNYWTLDLHINIMMTFFLYFALVFPVYAVSSHYAENSRQKMMS